MSSYRDKLLRWQFFIFFCVPEFVLGSLSLLKDACQRRNIESWLGVYRWVGTGCWWVSGGLVRGVSFYHYSYDRCHCYEMRVSEQTLHDGRVGTGRRVLTGG